MHDNVVVKQRVNAPVEKVWNALTDKAQMKEWYFDIPDFELGLHNEFNFYEPGDAKKFHHHGEILEIIPQSKLKHSWSYPEYSKDKTLVKWELEPDGEGTMVTLTHKGLENFDHLGLDFATSNFEDGWKEIVGKALKDYVEN
ncbi:SRPBCC domain-containing protein [Chryseobacterium suipulveris]|uniref:SRPBCC domain-containing protein n=1 Tax=Chryseobacterium suipulveris TaxID=2929800 RepID=A0ABY4BS87_9FLAO|nr:SRPBCC domain-containing protein [Chryseobacterium suipulveris]UOE42000.1 SRPBCC domain-containing protein [Chryseobacterium suipulveris]